MMEKSIISTLTYYDVLGGYPLTAFEIYKYLGKTVSFDELLKTLSQFKQKNGFYYLNDDSLVQQRIERQKIADRKWKKIRRIVFWLQMVPFVRAVGVSGSLAINNTRRESDLDLFIVAQKGHIWTVRGLLMALTQLIGQRRHGQIVDNKVCLNWFVTNESLELGLKNMSRAHFCAQLTPLWGDFSGFFTANQWMKEYLPSCFPVKKEMREIKTSRFLKSAAHILEFIFGGIEGLMKWQKRKIIRQTKPEYVSFSVNEMKKNTQAHLCLSDEALIFHYPVSRDLQIQELYARRCV
jgi:predicted nucleotidyltransferase